MDLSYKKILEKLDDEETGVFMAIANPYITKIEWKMSPARNKEIHVKLMSLGLYDITATKETHVQGEMTALGKMVYYSYTNFFNK